MKKLIYATLFLVLIFSNGCEEVDSANAELFCAAFANCVKGTAVPILYGHCICNCDEGWCGERCNVNKDACEGILEEKNDECDCRCIKPFSNPPACDKIIIPLVPVKEVVLRENTQTNDYFPLVAKNTWIFDVLDSMGMKEAEFGLEIHSSFEYEGLQMFDLRLLLPDTTTYLLSENTVGTLGPLLYNDPGNENQVVIYKTETQRDTFYRHSYNVPDTLIVDDTKLFVADAGTVVVPAGSYNNCISVVDESGTGNIFAPDIGWIVFLSDHNKAMVLAERNIECSVGAEIALTNLSWFNANDGSITISPTDSNTTLSFEWDGPTEIGNIGNPVNLEAGIYSVTISTGDCSAQVDSIPIESPPEIVLELSAVNASPGMDDGSATVMVSGGVPGYTFEWDDPAGQTTATASGLAPGIYNVTVTDSIGCEIMGTIEVNMSTGVRYLRESGISIFPNPAGEILYVQLENKNSNYTRFDIFDVNGRRVMSKQAEINNDGFFIITVGNLKEGLYFLRPHGESVGVELFIKL